MRLRVFNAVRNSDEFVKIVLIYIKSSIVTAVCLHAYKGLSFEAILLLLTVASDLKCQKL